MFTERIISHKKLSIYVSIEKEIEKVSQTVSLL